MYYTDIIICMSDILTYICMCVYMYVYIYIIFYLMYNVKNTIYTNSNNINYI